MKLFAFTISSRSCPRRSFTAASARPLLRIRARSAGSSSSSTRSTSSPLATKPGRLPSASFRSSPRPSRIARASSCIQPWNASPRGLVEGADDLVDLHRLLRGRARKRVAVLEQGPPRARRASARRRSRRAAPSAAAARACCSGSARSSPRARSSASVRPVHELLVHDLADVEPGHPHVGLLHEQRGLVEGRLEAVLLGLSGMDPPNWSHSSIRSAEDRQHERRHGRELRDCRGLLDHEAGQRSESASSSRTPRASSTSGADEPNCSSSICW